MAIEAQYIQTDELLDLAAGTARLAGEVIQDAGGRAVIVTRELTATEAGSVREGGVHDLPSAAGTLFGVGNNVYWDATANLAIAAASAAADDFPVGKALVAKVNGDTVVRTQLNAAGSGLVRAIAAAGDACTNTVAETTLAAKTIPAGTLQPGDVIRVRAQAIATNTNGADTLELKLRLGTEEIVTTGAVDVADGAIGYIEGDIVIRTGAAAGTIVAAGVQALGVPATVTAKPFLKGSAAEDLSGAVDVKLTALWSAAAAANSCRADVFNVQILRPGL